MSENDKKEIQVLSGMELQVFNFFDRDVVDTFTPRAHFDKDTGDLVIRSGEEENIYKDYKLVAGSASSLWVKYNGERYVSCSESDESKREAIAASVLVLIQNTIIMCSMLVTNAMTRIFRSYSTEIDKVKERIESYDKSDKEKKALIALIHYHMGFTPTFKAKKGKNGNYLVPKKVILKALTKEELSLIKTEVPKMRYTLGEVVENTLESLKPEGD